MKTILIGLSLLAFAVACNNKSPEAEKSQQMEEVQRDYREDINDAAQDRQEDVRDISEDFREDKHDQLEEQRDDLEDNTDM